MNNLSDMLWVELRKAVRSRMPLWTALGSMFFPLGMAFLIFVAKNPGISKNLGLVSAKANLVAYSATDWPSYQRLFALIIAAGGIFLFTLIISWVFGREFVDGTLKDLLAVPVQRSSILLAKFILYAIWSAGLAVLILISGLVTGALIRLPGGSAGAIVQGSGLILVTAGLVIWDVLPFAFLASLGRGYLLPIGIAVLVLLMTNLVAILGWGEYFPWAIPGLYPQTGNPLSPVSYVIVFLTGLAGIIATYFWWKYADQSR